MTQIAQLVLSKVGATRKKVYTKKEEERRSDYKAVCGFRTDQQINIKLLNVQK